MNYNFIKTLRLVFFIYLLSFLIISCAKENPDLVNPPLPSETVRIRLFNFASDKLERKLSIDGTVKTNTTAYASLSPAVTPPTADSILLSTLLNDKPEYTDSTKLKLWRDMRYIIFALPKPNSNKPVDTLITTVTSFAPVRDTNHCYISLININNEADAKYSVVLGCPNGQVAFPPVSYMNKSIEQEILAGKLAVSIIKIGKDNKRKSLGLFDLQLERRGDYLFVIMGDTPAQIKIINRRNDGPGAMNSLNLISATLAKIRTLNFTKSEISIKKSPDNIFLESLAGNSISAYTEVTACTSDFLDSIVVMKAGAFSSFVKTGLVVNHSYSLLVFDSKDGEASNSMIIENPTELKYPKNSAAVQVINMAKDYQPFGISLGARDALNTDVGYVAGEQLASNLEYGKISGRTYVLAGRAPITVFSATSPQRLLHSFIGNFEAGKNYLLVVRAIDKEDINISIIDESKVNSAINNIETGAYTRLVHFVPELDSIRISIDNVLTNAKVFYSNSLATVLPLGQNTIRTKGVEKTFTGEKDFRDLLVATGTKEQAEIVHIHTKSMAYNSSLFNRRVLNVAKDEPLLTVYDDDVRLNNKIKPFVKDLAYGKVSEIQPVYLERKFSYLFYDKTDGELLKQTSNISMSFGKNFTIIFGGNKKVISKKPLTYNYSILLLQEY